MLNHILLAVLFFVLVPGVVLTLPKGGNKFTVAAVHAVVFVVAFYLLNTYVLEGFGEGANKFKPSGGKVNFNNTKFGEGKKR